jgi:Cu/Ag efflux pump CusA
MPVDVFPDLTAPTVTVITEAHGMAPEELETRVTLPIESSLNGAPGVRRVRSATGVGISVIYAEFEWGTDVFRARQVVSEKLQLVRDALPAEVEQPVLAPISSIMGEVLFLAVTTDGATRHGGAHVRGLHAAAKPARGARRVAGDRDGRGAQAVRGRAAPRALGGPRPHRRRGGARARGDQHQRLAGFIDEGGQEYLVHGVGRVRTPEDVGETLVVQRGDEAILVRHLGEVRSAQPCGAARARTGGRPAVIVGIQKQPGTNTLELTERIDRELDELSRTLPEGLRLERDIFRQADFIEVAVENVLAALRDGVALVLLIVLLFLASGRASAITIVAIPLSLVTAVFALSAFRRHAEHHDLGRHGHRGRRAGGRRRHRRGERGAAPAQNALLAEAERQPRSAGGPRGEPRDPQQHRVRHLVVVLVFLPLFFLSGVEGRLLAPLGIAYVVSLTASLFVAVTVTPVLCSFLLPGSKAVTKAHEPRFALWLKRRYAPLLSGAMRRWRLVAAVAFALLAVAGVALVLAGRSFLPEFREGTLVVAAVTLPGTSLAESDAMGRRIEEILLGHPEVVTVARRTGRAEMDEHAQGTNAAELDVSCARRTGRARTSSTSCGATSRMLPGMNITIGQPIGHRIDHMLSGTRASIAVKVFGDDLSGAASPRGRGRGRHAQCPGRGRPRARAAVGHPLRAGALRPPGHRPARHAHRRRGARARGRLRRPRGVAGHGGPGGLRPRRAHGPDARPDVRGPARAAGGHSRRRARPAACLASVQRDRGPNEIGRENVQRRLVVSCNVAGRDVGSVVGDIQAPSTRRWSSQPATVAYGGQFESAEGAARTLGLLSLLCLLGMLGLLYTAFGSLRDAVLVMVNLPLALIGGAAGVFLQGGVLSVASLVGFITLFGIATRNGIMLVSHIRHLVHEEGVRDIDEAVRAARRSA